MVPSIGKFIEIESTVVVSRGLGREMGSCCFMHIGFQFCMKRVLEVEGGNGRTAV